jgi:hypothetical protein
VQLNHNSDFCCEDANLQIAAAYSSKNNHTTDSWRQEPINCLGMAQAFAVGDIS